MSLLKNNFKVFLTLFFIFSSFWIYRILDQFFLLGIVVIVITLAIVLSSKNRGIIVISLILLFFLQYQTTEIKSLIILDNDEQRVQQERIRSYPLTYMNLFFKVIWFKPEFWIEQNKYVIAFSKIEENFFENLDINKYFFGGFPRNSPSDFQKFLFILLPLFIIGVFDLLRKKKFNLLFFLFLFPIFLLSIIGNRNPLGPFSLFPFIVVSMIYGIEELSRFIKNRTVFGILFVVIIVIFFSIQLNYG